MKIAVYISRENEPSKENLYEGGVATLFEGYLTDESSSSSYGLPVLIDQEGNPYGPTDLLNMGISEPLSITGNPDRVGKGWRKKDTEFCKRAAQAGYRIIGINAG